VNRATSVSRIAVPLVAFQLAFERTWTDKGKSLAASQLPAALRTEDTPTSCSVCLRFE